MSTFLQLYGIGLILLVCLDLLWIGIVARDFYQAHLGYLLGPVSWVPAICFYLLFMSGFTYFVTLPLVHASWPRIMFTAALFSGVAYATYDLTNHATLRDWPAFVTYVDILWGCVLGAIIALGTIGIHRALF